MVRGSCDIMLISLSVCRPHSGTPAIWAAATAVPYVMSFCVMFVVVVAVKRSVIEESAIMTWATMSPPHHHLRNKPIVVSNVPNVIRVISNRNYGHPI